MLPEPLKSRRLLLAVGAVGVVWVVTAMVQSASMRPPPASFVPPPMPSGRGSVGLASDEGLLEDEEQVSSLTAPVGGAEKEEDPPLTLDEFMGMLEESAPKPLAEKVARAFVKEPTLQLAWKVYQKKRGGKAPAREFINYISKLPQFRQLLARFQGEPGFKQAFASVVKGKEINKAIREGLANSTLRLGGTRSTQALRGKGPGAGAVDADAIARDWERKAHSGVRLPGGMGALPPDGTATRDMIPVLSGGRITGGGGSAMGGAGAGQGLLGGAGGAGGGAGTHDATKFDKGWKAVEAVDKGRQQFEGDRRLMTVLMKSLTAAEIEALERAMCANPKYPCDPNAMETNIWGACWKTGMYARCTELCLTGAAQDCPSDMTSNAFNACRASGDLRPPSTCILECLPPKESHGCRQGNINEGEWNDACRLKTVPREKCLKTQRYGDGCTNVTKPDGSVECRPDTGQMDGDANADWLADLPTDTTTGDDTGTTPGTTPGTGTDCSKAPDPQRCLEDQVMASCRATGGTLANCASAAETAKCAAKGQEPDGEGGCRAKCAANQQRDDSGACVRKCTTTEERVDGICRPKCGPGEQRGTNGQCAKPLDCKGGQVPNADKTACVCTPPQVADVGPRCRNKDQCDGWNPGDWFGNCDEDGKPPTCDTCNPFNPADWGGNCDPDPPGC
ncbi:MAG: hypothetical protein HY553_06755 [Elusimicrobia bacterium]|nr:hypothetical protein [Elusimicrobiota bacterium]